MPEVHVTDLLIVPAPGLVLLRREHPEHARRRAIATPVMPVMIAEDRALCRVGDGPSPA